MPSFDETIQDVYGGNAHTREHDKLADLGNLLADETAPGMVLTVWHDPNPQLQHLTSNVRWDSPQSQVASTSLIAGTLYIDATVSTASTAVVATAITAWSITWPENFRAGGLELHLHYDGSGVRPITWPATWYTPDGQALPATGPGPGEVLVVALSTFNAGTTILAAAQVFG